MSYELRATSQIHVSRFTLHALRIRKGRKITMYDHSDAESNGHPTVVLPLNGADHDSSRDPQPAPPWESAAPAAAAQPQAAAPAPEGDGIAELEEIAGRDPDD